MQYFVKPDYIISLIDKFAQTEVLWIDTEIADFKSRSPKVSLIQVLTGYADNLKENVAILDVLNQPELTDIFIQKIIDDLFHFIFIYYIST